MTNEWAKRISTAPLAVSLCVVLLGQPAFAQQSGALTDVPVAAAIAALDSPDPAERRLAKSALLFDYALPPDRFRTVLEGLRPSLEQAMRDRAARVGRPLPPNAATRLLEILGEEMAGTMDAVLERVAPIYAQALSEAELDALLTLYATPDGRSAMAKIPLVSAQVSKAMEGDLQRLSVRVLERLQTEFGPPGPPRAPAGAPAAQ